MSIDLDQFHDVYFAEGFEALDVMEASLAQLVPGAADKELINTLFRVAHSIKGGAGVFGFNDIALFTHTLESLLDEMRAGRLQVTAPLRDGLLQSVDQLRAMIVAAQAGVPPDLTVASALQEQFRRLVAQAVEPAEAPAAAATIPRATSVWHIHFKALPELLKRGNDPLRMFEELSGFGSLQVRADCSAVPAIESLDPAHCAIQWDLLLTTDVPRSTIETVFEWADGDCVVNIECTDGVAKAASSVPTGVSTHRLRPLSSNDASSIRVAIEKFDELLNTVGEIVTAQSMLGQLASRFEGADAEHLRAGLGQLKLHIRELQDCVMRVRMLPVSSIFNRFPRLVRDLAIRLGKQIDLQISGEQTEMDKSVLEKIGDPLMHLVRNSIDHGIESSDIRVAAGKPAAGVVRLDASHRGGTINIVISDDGKGLDKHKLLEKARSKGLIDANAVLTDEQAFELIFLPGISTAPQITDLSGRGVGMDVVRRNINDLGGSVELRSELGKGTTTLITLPLTLAIVEGQIVAVGSETYIVPMGSIVESLQLTPSDTNHVYRMGEVFSYRGDYLPIIRLHEIFAVKPRSRALTEGLVMVVEGDGRRAGLFIDELSGQQQVVIKSLETHYARIEGIGGATILAEGSVALILDVPGLLRMATSNPNGLSNIRESA